MRFQVGFATDIGRKRAQNQDNVAALPEMNLYMVADGMGGHRGGETASALAVEITRDLVGRAQAGADWDPQTALVDAIKSANRMIYTRASQQPELQGMGTTITALLFRDNALTIGHVGDSRCYFFRPNSVWQVTRDHSVVQEKLRAGLITREELKTDRMKNVITRSVGFEPDVTVEIYRMIVRAGDTFLICSDGLSGLVEDTQMLEVIKQHLFGEKDVPKTLGKLVETANANGGDDNITTVLVRVLNDDGSEEDETTDGRGIEPPPPGSGNGGH